MSAGGAPGTKKKGRWRQREEIGGGFWEEIAAPVNGAAAG
jgi:hypothetical protein